MDARIGNLDVPNLDDCLQSDTYASGKSPFQHLYADFSLPVSSGILHTAAECRNAGL